MTWYELNVSRANARGFAIGLIKSALDLYEVKLITAKIAREAIQSEIESGAIPVDLGKQAIEKFDSMHAIETLSVVPSKPSRDQREVSKTE